MIFSDESKKTVNVNAFQPEAEPRCGSVVVLGEHLAAVAAERVSAPFVASVADAAAPSAVYEQHWLLLRCALMLLLLLLRELLMLLLLLGVELLLLLLILLIRCCISSVWRRGLRMRRKILRVGRSRRVRSVVFRRRSRRIPCGRNCCPFRRAGWRTIGGRWLRYGVITRSRLSCGAIRGRMIRRSSCFGRYDSGAAECCWLRGSGDRWFAVI